MLCSSLHRGGVTLFKPAQRVLPSHISWYRLLSNSAENPRKSTLPDSNPRIQLVDQNIRKKPSHKPQESVKDKAALDQRGTGPCDLKIWRQQVADLRWQWTNKGAVQNHQQVADVYGRSHELLGCRDLASCAAQVLRTANLEEKISWTHCAWHKATAEKLAIGSAEVPDLPSRPDKPELVDSRDVPLAKESGVPLNVYMLLNLAHVELNAIDLAWDTVARFADAGLPREFYLDFAHVAEDESRHLGWCLQRLEELGHAYGDICAHNQLWNGAQASSRDVTARLVVVPCSQEARGLDAGPRLVERLTSMGDLKTAAIVHQICKEELSHVAVGAFWYRSICSVMEVEAGTLFRTCIMALCPDLLSGNYNHAARINAGLTQSWYDKQLWEGETDLAALPDIPQLNARQLSELRDRLSSVLDLEQASCEPPASL